MSKSLISLDRRWASLTGSGMCICAETDIIVHMDRYIQEPAYTPLDPHIEGAVVANPNTQDCTPIRVQRIAEV